MQVFVATVSRPGVAPIVLLGKSEKEVVGKLLVLPTLQFLNKDEERMMLDDCTTTAEVAELFWERTGLGGYDGAAYGILQEVQEL